MKSKVIYLLLIILHNGGNSNFILAKSLADDFVSGARINRDANDHVISSDPPLTKAQRRSMERADKDVVDLQRPVARRRGFSASGAKATVDLAFVVDYEFSQKFNFNQQNLLNYLTIMVNSVNSRYSLMEDPKISFKLTGIHVTTTADAQTYIQQAKNGTYGYSISKMLDLFSVWTSQNMKILPPHDLLVLLSKVESDTESVGIAFLRGACWLEREGLQKDDKSHAVAITLDDGETYAGALTLAHELAHCLGAPHDGKPESKDCSWTLGHVMSYEGYGTLNKYHFSECSKRLMKAFLESTGAFCLYKDVTTKYIPLPENKDVGDVVNHDQRCKLETKSDTAYGADDTTADEYCRNVYCRIPKEGGGYQRKTRKNIRPPGENSPCGRGGKCVHGMCVGNQETPTERLDLKTLCTIRSKNPKAQLLAETSADTHCEYLRCSLDPKGMPVNYGEVLDGTLCGVGGVCQNKKCVGNKEVVEKKSAVAPASDAKNLTEFCVQRTGYAQAKISDSMLPSEYCKVLKCDWVKDGKPKIRTIGAEQGYYPPDNSFPCGYDGKCVNKVCVEQSPDRLDMNKMCQYVLKNPESFVTRKDGNVACETFSCSFPNPENPDRDIWRKFTYAPEEGSSGCGADKKGTCKNKVCVGG